MGTRTGAEVGEKTFFRESRIHGYQTAAVAEEPAAGFLPSFNVFYFLDINTVPGGKPTC